MLLKYAGKITTSVSYHIPNKKTFHRRKFPKLQEDDEIDDIFVAIATTLQHTASMVKVVMKLFVNFIFVS